MTQRILTSKGVASKCSRPLKVESVALLAQDQDILVQTKVFQVASVTGVLSVRNVSACKLSMSTYFRRKLQQKQHIAMSLLRKLTSIFCCIIASTLASRRSSDLLAPFSVLDQQMDMFDFDIAGKREEHSSMPCSRL